MAKTSTHPPPREGSVEAPRSDAPGDALGHQPTPPDLTGVSAATASPKRGRGRPAKPKSDSQQNGAAVSPQPSGRPRGRPKKIGSPAAAATASEAPAVRRGRGRPKRSNPLPVTASLVTTVDGSRKRGRPKRDDVSAAATVPASTLAPAKKRGPKPKARRSAGRPRKDSSLETGTTGQEAADTRALKKKCTLLRKKAKEAGEMLKAALSKIEEVNVLAADL